LYKRKVGDKPHSSSMPNESIDLASGKFLKGYQLLNEQYYTPVDFNCAFRFLSSVKNQVSSYKERTTPTKQYFYSM